MRKQKKKRQRLKEEAKYKVQIRNYFKEKPSERDEQEIQKPETSLSQPQCSSVGPSTITNDSEENYNDLGTEYTTGVSDDTPSSALNSININLKQQFDSPSNDHKVESDLERDNDLKIDDNGDLNSLEDASSLKKTDDISAENVDGGEIFMVSSVIGKTLARIYTQRRKSVEKSRQCVH